MPTTYEDVWKERDRLSIENETLRNQRADVGRILEQIKTRISNDPDYFDAVLFGMVNKAIDINS